MKLKSLLRKVRISQFLRIDNRAGVSVHIEKVYTVRSLERISKHPVKLFPFVLIKFPVIYSFIIKDTVQAFPTFHFFTDTNSHLSA